MAQKGGACVVEWVICEKCQQTSFAGHHWSETVKCMHCQHQQASRVPRLPSRGEITVDHYQAAIGHLGQIYSKMIPAGWTPEAEWTKLDDHTKILITANISAAALAMLKQVQSLAQGMAMLSAKV